MPVLAHPARPTTDATILFIFILNGKNVPLHHRYIQYFIVNTLPNFKIDQAQGKGNHAIRLVRTVGYPLGQVSTSTNDELLALLEVPSHKW